MNKKLVNIMLIMALTITLIMAINAFVASAQDPGFEVEGGEITETYEDFEDIPEEFLEEALVEEEIIIEEAGITPDSPFYFVDEIIDTITLAAAEGEEKAEKAAEIAAEKVAEAKLMADKNLTDETLEALEILKNSKTPFKTVAFPLYTTFFHVSNGSTEEPELFPKVNKLSFLSYIVG